MSAFTIVYAALGTNLGDKLANLEAGIDALQSLAGEILDTSRLYCTAPQYVEEQPSFFNIVVKLKTSLSPKELLDCFKSIEKKIGRKPSIRYGPRLIDVDILFYGDAIVTTETINGPLIIPHEKIAERDFVLAPFCDITPEFIHPRTGKSMKQLYDDLLAKKKEDNMFQSAVVPLLPVNKKNPWILGSKTFVMGIINVTPDSFSDGGSEFLVVEKAVAKSLEMEQAGVDIIDIGGESSRPGAKPVSLEEEIKRVVPVIEAIRSKSDIPISIDTTKSEVAFAAIKAGANVVNDISAGMKDENMFPTLAALRIPIVLMHMRGDPQTMTKLKEYDDIVEDVSKSIVERVHEAKKAGIFSWNVIVDPGIGFAKGGEQNLTLTKRLSTIKNRCYQLPILYGASRKAFIGQICGRTDPKARAWGTAAVCCAAIAQSADILRVHDIPEMIDVAKMADALWRTTT